MVYMTDLCFRYGQRMRPANTRKWWFRMRVGSQYCCKFYIGGQKLSEMGNVVAALFV